MALKPEHIQLAKTLPPRLLNFFRKHPTPALLQATRPPAEASDSGAITTAPVTSSNDPNASSGDSHPLPSAQTEYRNPFQPWKNFVTGRWRGPKYGLRQQADLVKLAARYGVEELLPYTIKGTGEKARRRAERGLRVKGTGVGQKVKGKLWERTLKGRLEERKQAMLKMPAMIQEWKQRGHGRGWKKWPK